MPINSRAKGKRIELELAHKLTELGHPARRGQQFSGGNNSPDIVCLSLNNIHIECKGAKRADPAAWYRQAVEDAGEGKTPVVMYKINNDSFKVLLSLEDFVSLISERKDKE